MNILPIRVSSNILFAFHFMPFVFKEQIVSTQPRKLAARSLASRVAEEYGCQVGEEVSPNYYYDCL
jgi:HrpA-like RNA helicase